jgi:hypothetical protein
VGHEGGKDKPERHPPQALELLKERRRKRKRVQGFEPIPHEVENEIVDLTLFFGLNMK